MQSTTSIEKVISSYGWIPYHRYDKSNTWREYAKPYVFNAPSIAGVAYATDGYQDVAICGSEWKLVSHSTVLHFKIQPPSDCCPKRIKSKPKRALELELLEKLLNT